MESFCVTEPNNMSSHGWSISNIKRNHNRNRELCGFLSCPNANTEGLDNQISPGLGELSEPRRAPTFVPDDATFLNPQSLAL